MKFASLIIMLISASQATMNCNIQFFEEDPENWRDISAGFLLGLVANQTTVEKKNCIDCWDLGNNIALINKGLVFIEKNTDKWIDQAKIVKQDLTKIEVSLTEVYYIFATLMVPLDRLLQNASL